MQLRSLLVAALAFAMAPAAWATPIVPAVSVSPASPSDVPAAPSSDATAAIVLPLPWTADRVVSYRSDAQQDKLRNGKHVQFRTRETLEIRVLDAGPDGIVLRWSNLAPVVEASGDAPTLDAEKAAVEALAARFGDLPYEVELSANGEFRGLRNWEALGEATREVMLPVLVAQAKTRPELALQDDTALRARYAPVLERMTTREATTATLGREAMLFNFFLGATLVPGQAREYEDVAPAPWGPDAIPTRGRVELGAVDEAAGTVTLHWTQSIDPVKGREVLLKSIAALAGKPVPADAPPGLPAGVRLDDEATVVIARDTGLPLRLEHVREVEFGGARSTQRWTLEQLPSP